MRFAESYTNDSIEDTRVGAEGSDSGDKRLRIGVDVAIFHLLEQCLERFLISRHVLPIDCFFLINDSSDELDVGLDDHEEAASTVTYALSPLEVL